MIPGGGPVDAGALESGLKLMHPVIQAWFAKRFGEPTSVQDRAWQKIASGQHVLISAPTGRGKTLAAFLWSLHRLLTLPHEVSSVGVLYVSPLKALNQDVQANLLQPLDELKARFANAGLKVPELRVLTRSGDTPASDRQRMLRRPPHILITTPESLHLILSSARARHGRPGPPVSAGCSHDAAGSVVLVQR